LCSEGEWEEFVERLARDLTPALRKRVYMAQLERLRGLGPPSDKLIYLYLVVAEPQPFVGVWRGLGIGVKTVDRALRRLREGTSSGWRISVLGQGTGMMEVFLAFAKNFSYSLG
jgi:hypothetical protein